MGIFLKAFSEERLRSRCHGKSGFVIDGNRITSVGAAWPSFDLDSVYT